MMRVLDGAPFDQIFAHVDDKGVIRHFNCGAIMRAIAQRKITPDFATLPVPEHVYQHLLAHHGIEQVHLDRLSDRQLDSPILLAHFNDGSDLIIDGNHRLVRRYQKGLQFVEALVLQESDWTPYLVTDIDQTYTLEEAASFLQRQAI